ncbi:hypothetical protein RRG08_010566 [Elysia crispata]|uniref:Uncharacterized protein n=1 Tax=Elysia crispata TaxID=231223 RepID=A0AAE0ZU45_9GAST|nr:hypothetical protein RRG08_010566 [Elysia crispata]
MCNITKKATTRAAVMFHLNNQPSREMRCYHGTYDGDVPQQPTITGHTMVMYLNNQLSRDTQCPVLSCAPTAWPLPGTRRVPQRVPEATGADGH